MVNFSVMKTYSLCIVYISILSYSIGVYKYFDIKLFKFLLFLGYFMLLIFHLLKILKLSKFCLNHFLTFCNDINN